MLQSDADKLFVILSARALKALAFGANYSSEKMGGRRLDGALRHDGNGAGHVSAARVPIHRLHHQGQATTRSASRRNVPPTMFRFQYTYNADRRTRRLTRREGRRLCR